MFLRPEYFFNKRQTSENDVLSEVVYNAKWRQIIVELNLQDS